MDAAFCRIEALKASGMSSEAAFKAVLDLTWSSSTFSDHYRVWKICPSNIMLRAVRLGRGIGGEWRPLAKEYGKKK
jgi:hypothetical protein